MRRLLDITVASLALVVSFPVTLTAALAIYAVNPGPVLYRATRVGLHGRKFTMYKLRTMYLGAGNSGSVVTAATDGRVFPAGRWLRRLKIDELPQMMNIIKGDMSIVGPRPRDPKIVGRCYTSLHRETLQVRPGLTSPGTLFYLTHGEPTLRTSDPENDYQVRILPIKLALDIAYVRRRNLWLDLWIVVRTVGAIFGITAWRLDSREVERARAYIQPARNTGPDLSGSMAAQEEAKNGNQEDLRDR